MGRKNNRRKIEYKRSLGFNPRRYLGSTSGYGSAIEYRGSPHAPMLRGDIWFARLGRHPGTSVQSGWAPVLIVSNDMANAHARTVTVLPMTRILKKPDLPCHVALDPASVTMGQDWEMSPSMILAEQITTIGKGNLWHYIGRVEDAAVLDAVHQAMKAQLELDAALPGERPDAALPGERPDAALPGERPDAALPGERPDAALRCEKPATVLPGDKPATVLPCEK